MKKLTCIILASGIILMSLMPSEAQATSRKRAKSKKKSTAQAALKKKKSVASLALNTKPAAAVEDKSTDALDVVRGTSGNDFVFSDATSRPEQMRSVLEKPDIEILQELFGLDVSQKTKEKQISAYWLGQSRLSIPTPYAKIFPKESLYTDNKTLTINDLDATQRVELGDTYEAFILTPTTSNTEFFLLLYNKKQKAFVSNYEKVAYDSRDQLMHYTQTSYIKMDEQTQRPMLYLMTKSTRNDEDTCKTNCFEQVRLEVKQFNGATWGTQYILRRNNYNGKATYAIETAPVGRVKELEAKAPQLFDSMPVR